MLDKSLLQGRDFQIWHYVVSHGHLLIRSCIDNRNRTNVDLWFTAVRYVEAPRHLGKIELGDASNEERKRLKTRTDEFFDRYLTTVIVSGTNRFYVVSNTVSIEENELEIFQTPYEAPPESRTAFIQHPGY
jgi:hypothetical protein